MLHSFVFYFFSSSSFYFSSFSYSFFFLLFDFDSDFSLTYKDGRPDVLQRFGRCSNGNLSKTSCLTRELFSGFSLQGT
jgi:hypothetical protein